MAAESTDQGNAQNAEGKEKKRDEEHAVDDESADDSEEESDGEDDEDDDEDDEPKLKYARLTSSLAPVYRNGDATSCFAVAGDKMVC